ncbi:MAG: hypothetical protein U9P70_02765 [Patescibacteria group bacterium]|nr:hypothetical protein [Patescibacteria group bacterium]
MSENFKSFVNNFSKFFQKNKKFQKKHFLSIAIVLFLVVVSVSIPVYEAQAGFVNIGTRFLTDGIKSLINDPGGTIMNLIYVVAFAILNLGLYFSTILVKFGAWCIDIALDSGLYVGDASNPGVLTSTTVDIGWTTVRDMCNTFYLFFLLIIAFGTILRSSTFNAKNLLPKLIISLFLINFSAVIAKLVIDFGQVFLYEIRNWMGTFQGGAGSLTSIVDQFNIMLNNSSSASLDKVILVAFALAYSLVLGFVYIMLAIFLLIRLVAFVFLIILSPIAFLSIVMPSMSKYTSEWWSELVKYSLFGPIFMFFVYLSATMANELVTNFTPLAATSSDLNIMNGVVRLIIPNSIPLLMLLAVIPITQRLGVAGSNKIIGGAAGIGKIAMGTYAGVKLAGGYGRKAGKGAVSRNESVRKGYDVLKKERDKIDKKLPGGGVRASKRNAEDKKSREEKMKKEREKHGAEKERELTVMHEIATGSIKKGQVPATKEEKALFVETAAGHGKVADYKDDIEKLFPAVEASLSDKELKELTHRDLDLATMTSGAQDRIENKKDDTFSDEAQQRIKDKGGSKDAYKEEIMREEVLDIIEDGGDVNKIKNLKGKMQARAINDSLDSGQKKAFKAKLSKKQQAEFSEGLAANGLSKEEYKQAEKDSKDDTKSKKEQEKAKKILKKDEEIKIDAVNFGGDVEKVFEKSGKDFEKHIGKAFGKFDPKVVAKMSDEDLEKYGAETTSSQSTRIHKEGYEEKFEIIEKAKSKKKDELLGLNKTQYEALLKDKEKLKTEKDPDKKITIENNIKSREEAIPNLEKIIDFEKQIDNMKSRISGDKF